MADADDTLFGAQEEGGDGGDEDGGAAAGRKRKDGKGKGELIDENRKVELWSMLAAA
jgi:hypothetical protein